MKPTKEQIYQIGKEKFVSDIVTEILNNDSLDDTLIKEVCLDDGGNCIHIAFSGAVSASTFIAISEAFGDKDPDVYANGENLFEVVLSNHIEELID